MISSPSPSLLLLLLLSVLVVVVVSVEVVVDPSLSFSIPVFLFFFFDIISSPPQHSNPPTPPLNPRYKNIKIQSDLEYPFTNLPATIDETNFHDSISPGTGAPNK